jgi:hypothetical protein
MHRRRQRKYTKILNASEPNFRYTFAQMTSSEAYSSGPRAKCKQQINPDRSYTTERGPPKQFTLGDRFFHLHLTLMQDKTCVK